MAQESRSRYMRFDDGVLPSLITGLLGINIAFIPRVNSPSAVGCGTGVLLLCGVGVFSVTSFALVLSDIISRGYTLGLLCRGIALPSHPPNNLRPAA